MILQVAILCGKLSWPNLRNTDTFYSVWERQHFLMFCVSWNFHCKYQHIGFLKCSMIPGSCWLKSVWCSSGSVLPASWAAAVTFMIMLILLSVCLLPSVVWIAGMGLSSGLPRDFRVSRPPSQLAPLLAEAGFLAIPWNPAPLFIRDAGPGAAASLLWWSHVMLESSQSALTGTMINWYSQRHWCTGTSLSLVPSLYNYQT